MLQGKAEVPANPNQEALLVEQRMYVPFAPVLVPERSIDEPRDALSTWAEGRQQSISADNAIAANIQDPASMNTSGIASFTYFPMLGLPASGPGLYSTYSSLGTDEPGFNSIYLPGYTYLPVFAGLGLGGFRTPLGLPPYAEPLFPRAPGPHRYRSALFRRVPAYFTRRAQLRRLECTWGFAASRKEITERVRSTRGASAL